jgi:hypothetical protein
MWGFDWSFKISPRHAVGKPGIAYHFPPFKHGTTAGRGHKSSATSSIKEVTSSAMEMAIELSKLPSNQITS